MILKMHFNPVLVLTLVVIVLLLVVVLVRPVNAGRGIILRLPFNGIHRVTSYFDHQSPNYAGDSYIWIYNGERVAS